MERKINFTFMPTLEHIVLVKIAVRLWNLNDIIPLTIGFTFKTVSDNYQRSQWRRVEKKVMQKVMGLLLPEAVKRKLLDFIKPIGVEILEGREHRYDGYVTKFLQDKLRWTPQGTVDKKKSVEDLVKDKTMHISCRYRIACLFCLEDDISSLWKILPKFRRANFYSDDPRNVQQDELVIIWTYDLQGEIDSLHRWMEERGYNCRPYHFAFECAALSGNKAATEWFLRKLTREEAQECFVTYAKFIQRIRRKEYCQHFFLKEPYADVLCFLLSQMNEGQMMEVIDICAAQLLACLLDWPRQRFFLEIASHAWDSLSNVAFCYLLKKIIFKEKEEYCDYNYWMLFKVFWKQSSDSHKRYVINTCITDCLLSDLIGLKDENYVKLIVKDATPDDKKMIIQRDRGRICKSLIYDDKWNLLVFFVEECISKADAIKYKCNFKKWISREEIALKRYEWFEFFKLLDNLSEYDENNGRNDGILVQRHSRGKFAKLTR